MGEEELRKLKERVKKLTKAQESTDERLNAMKSEMEIAKEQARLKKEKRGKAVEQARREREKYEKSMGRIRKEKEILNNRIKELQTQHSEELERLKATVVVRQYDKLPEPMKLEVCTAPVPASSLMTQPTKAASSGRTKAQITEQDLKNFSALRPPIKGIRAVIPDRKLPPPEIERDEGDHRVSKKRKAGTKKAAWDKMDVFSSTSMDIEECPLPPLPVPISRSSQEENRGEEARTSETGTWDIDIEEKLSSSNQG